jgi:hypothetical protein
VTTNQKGWRFFKNARPVIVVMKTGETAEQAWQRHIKTHPKDSYADVKIFHVSPRITPRFLPGERALSPETGREKFSKPF